MAAKLEKAQDEYERLLRDLAEKAIMLEQLQLVSPGVRQAFEQAREALADRRLELEFIETEIARQEESSQQSREKLEQRKQELEQLIEGRSGAIDVKKSKLAPLTKALAGAEYDFKFADKAMTAERQKYDKAQRTENHDAVRRHQANLKRMKIDIMKRRRQIDNLKQQIAKLEKPVKEYQRELDEYRQELESIESRLADSAGEQRRQLIEGWQQQHKHKEGELRRAELLVRDRLADVGEDLFDRRVNHPVLQKYYPDLDNIARVIDELMGEGKK